MEDIRRFIQEDVGQGDITSEALFTNEEVKGWVYPRKKCLLAGLREADMVFKVLGLKSRRLATEGKWVRANSPVLMVQGKAVDVLKGERLALNFLMRMSGIATETARIVERCARRRRNAIIAGTRKTVPGFRKYDKRAIKLGGGWPHRMGLYDGVLIKDNHLRLLSIPEAVTRAKRTGRDVEIEVSDFREAREAAEAGADIVMLDNMDVEHARNVSAKLRLRYPRVRIEVSGGITPDNAHKYAKFADVVSLGWLTHSGGAANFTMDIRYLPPSPPKRSRKR
jgi:nicotinate-nucleotide pyrophosphorylase (carboxylating)